MSAECFSGECEFCDCCTRTHHYVSDTDTDEPDKRASDMAKFISKDDIQKEFETYQKSLLRLKNLYSYLEKSEQGFTPFTLNVENSIFTLTNSFKKCDSVLCRIFHKQLHENICKQFIHDIPIYRSTSDKHFCLVCLRRS